MAHKFDIKDTFPAIEDLRKTAKLRTPHFAFEYLECGTGRDETTALNEAAMAAIRFTPNFLAGAIQPEIEVELFGQRYSKPIGIAPVGMASLVWPGAEKHLATLAASESIPFCMSTLAAETMETITEAVGKNGWFQLYPTRSTNIRDRMIEKARDLDFKALVLTVDVPIPSVRERQKRAGLSVPPRKDLAFWLSILQKPAWALGTLMRGEPRFLTLENYIPSSEMENQSQFFAEQMGGTLDWDYFGQVRKLWKGPLLLKGILSVHDAKLALAAGADGIWISNHGGRQFDACPAAIDCIAPIRDAVGSKMPLMFDSGIRSGLDVMRALYEGADFVFAGRPFVYGVAADPTNGAYAALNILERDLINAMVQTGCATIDDIRKLHRTIPAVTQA